MYNPEKLATQVTQDKEEKNIKNTNTMCVEEHYPQASTHNVNKT
jgi:hypothetical protein